MFQIIFSVIALVVMTALGLLWLAEWVIWGLWVFPGIVGLYLWGRSGRPQDALRDHYVGMSALACTWPWGWSLGEFVLPALSRWGRHVATVPYRDVQNNSFDVTLIVIAVVMTVAGFVGFVHAVALQVAAPRSTRESRVTVYRLVGLSGVALGVAGLVLTDHYIAAIFLAVLGTFVTLASSSFPEDPARSLTRIRERKSQPPVEAAR